MCSQVSWHEINFVTEFKFPWR